MLPPFAAPDPAQADSGAPGDVPPGDPVDLVPRVYEELRRMADHYLNGQRAGETLSTTVLVHEAYLRLYKHGAETYPTKAHFFGVAAKAMRSILVDHARRRGAAKRGGGRERRELDEGLFVCPEPNPDVIAVDEALTRLGEIDQRKAQIVELRFFGGLSVEEVAEALDISLATVKRQWTLAKAWLRQEMSGTDSR